MSWVDVYYRQSTWVDITAIDSWSETPWDDVQDWARSEFNALMAMQQVSCSWLEARRRAKTLARFYAAYSKRRLGMETYLHVLDLSQEPIPVFLNYGPAEGDRTRALRRLTRADDPDLLRPPQLDTFHAGHLGEGLKALGHVVLDDGEIVANLWYAFRDETHQVDVVVFASTGDLVRLGEVVPDIEALVHGIKVRADDEEGWWAGVADDIPADVDG